MVMLMAFHRVRAMVGELGVEPFMESRYQTGVGGTVSEFRVAFAAELANRIQNLRTQMEVRQIRSAPERVLQSLHLRCDSSGRWKQDGTLKQFAEV